MKRKLLIMTFIVLTVIILCNYPNIAVTVMSRMQFNEEVTNLYNERIEPKAKFGEIAKVALGSMISMEDKHIKYIAIDTKRFESISRKEVQYLVNHFKQYNNKVIYASMQDLKRMGLFNSFRKHLNGGVLLAIDKVEEVTNESAVLEVSYYFSGLGAAGYRCMLIYKDGGWQVKSMEMRYIA